MAEELINLDNQKPIQETDTQLRPSDGKVDYSCPFSDPYSDICTQLADLISKSVIEAIRGVVSESPGINAPVEITSGIRRGQSAIVQAQEQKQNSQSTWNGKNGKRL